jgi:hypothetical protein
MMPKLYLLRIVYLYDSSKRYGGVRSSPSIRVSECETRILTVTTSGSFINFDMHREDQIPDNSCEVGDLATH